MSLFLVFKTFKAHVTTGTFAPSVVSFLTEGHISTSTLPYMVAFPYILLETLLESNY